MYDSKMTYNYNVYQKQLIRNMKWTLGLLDSWTLGLLAYEGHTVFTLYYIKTTLGHRPKVFIIAIWSVYGYPITF